MRCPRRSRGVQDSEKCRPRPARCYQIGGIEESLPGPEGVGRRALNERKRRQRKGFRISQLAACIVAELPQPGRPRVMTVRVKIGELIVSGGVPSVARLEALATYRRIQVEPE